MKCNRWDAECSGPLNTALIYHYSTGADNVKVCIYSDDGDNIPDSGDSKVICTDAITSGSSAGWKSSVLSTNPSVIEGSGYFICAVTDSTAWSFLYTSGKTAYYQDLSYTTPPDNLAGTWGTVANQQISFYVTIGD
jgi:hypothetical protein